MPELMCALGILVGMAAIHWPSIFENVARAATGVTHSIEESRRRIEQAILSPQVSAVDLLIVAIADEAIEEVQFAAPERWRQSGGKAALSETELKDIRTRLAQVAAAGHAAALGQFEIVLRPGEKLGLSTHRPVNLAETTPSGSVTVREVFVSTLPTLQLNQLDLFGQQLTLTVAMSVRPTRGGENLAMSSFRMDQLQVGAGESLMLIAKNPLQIDQRATEQEGAGTRSLDHQHRLLLITPGRQPRPDSKGQIVRDRGVPQLAK